MSAKMRDIVFSPTALRGGGANLSVANPVNPSWNSFALGHSSGFRAFDTATGNTS